MLRSIVTGLPVHPPEDFAPDISRTVCITGHREKNISPYNGSSICRDMTVSAVKLMLYRYIDMACEQGYNCFISGLATGADLWAAEHILRKKQSGSRISLIGAMPYLRHCDYFSSAERELLIKAEQGADMLISVNIDPNISYSRSGAGKNLYRDRNYYMVDHASAVIAFLNSSAGFSGTQQTVSYAYRSGRKVCRFGIEDVFSIIDAAGTDIRSISKEISFLENAFELPFLY